MLIAFNPAYDKRGGTDCQLDPPMARPYSSENKVSCSTKNYSKTEQSRGVAAKTRRFSQSQED